MPGNELHPVRLPERPRGLLMVTVIDYRTTDIGTYVEFSIAIGLHPRAPARGRSLPAAVFMKRSGLGQYVVGPAGEHARSR